MRNIFEEIGKTPAEIEAKLNKAFSQLFEGDRENERICFDKGDDMAYIVDIVHNDIRSEGMSYGMTVAALLHKKDLFDKLWKFAKTHMKNTEGDLKGYYSWQVSTTDFTMMDPGPAPDGEEYFAAALLYAAKQFKCDEYKREAIELINDMAHKPESGEVYTMMDVNAGLVRFSPMKGNDYTDPSYNTVAFYRMYGEASGDEIWNKIADNSVAYLKRLVIRSRDLLPTTANSTERRRKRHGIQKATASAVTPGASCGTSGLTLQNCKTRANAPT